MRTCVGCRKRGAKSDLIRIVAQHGGRGSVLVLDIEGRLPGRGAHLHPRVECLDKAVRIRAFARALRLTGDIDSLAVDTALRSTEGNHDLRV